MKKIITLLLIFSLVFSITGCRRKSSDESTLDIEIIVEIADKKLENTGGKTDDSVPTEYASALTKAKLYSDMMHMSKASIYDQLVSEYGERFSYDAAQYALDNLNADWFANALAKAEEYNELMHMSKTGLHEQLISEYGDRFTKEEALYAVDNIDADWKANALEKAKEYQDTLSMSSAAIYDQLISEHGDKFTKEEAQYAIDNLE